MPIQQQLLDPGDLFNFSDLTAFTQNTPAEWLANALDLSAKTAIRRWSLPNDQVLWLVLGMAPFATNRYRGARRLKICAQGLASDPIAGAQQRDRSAQATGCRPGRTVFRQTGKQWGRERYAGDDWNGLRFKVACQYIAVQLIVMAAAGSSVGNSEKAC